MSSTSNAVPDVAATTEALAPAAPVRPLYWSIQRELWENRSIYFAPFVAAAIFMFGFVLSTIGMPHRRRATMMLDEAHQRAAIERPYDVIAMMLIATAFLVGVFYCLDALYGERRDRSILFWKSLPVSDRTTILSKAAIPMVILPALTFIVIVTTQFLMLAWTTIVLLPSGLAGTTWTRFNLITQSLMLLYGLIVIVLWHAPIYSWLLLVSAWAKRATFLWAVLPPLVLAAFETIAFHTSYVGKFLKYRFIGGFGEAFAFQPRGTLQQPGLTPGNFLVSPGLWIGLGFAAGCLAVAIRLRRNREPI